MPKRAFITSIMKVVGNVNADMGIGTRIPLKKILTWKQETKVFVSARCIRRCIRERLFEKGFKIDPLQLIGKEAKQLGDIGDPIEFIDDDIFGYLVPAEIPIKRISPVKISHLVSLRHTEIKPEFAARFPRDFLPKFAREYPVPFEIEMAEWHGRLGIIISNRIGRFEKDELKDELVKKHKDKLVEIEGRYYLDDKERYRRLKALLEVLLWEGWQFPRATQSPSIPEFNCSVIALTKHFVPIFGYVDIDEDEKISSKKLDDLRNLYGPLIDHLLVLDYRSNKYSSFKRCDDNLKMDNNGELNAKIIKQFIEEICNYIFSPIKSEET